MRYLIAVLAGAGIIVSTLALHVQTIIATIALLSAIYFFQRGPRETASL